MIISVRLYPLQYNARWAAWAYSWAFCVVSSSMRAGQISRVAPGVYTRVMRYRVLGSG